MTLSPTRILTVLASLALSITMSAQNVSISGQVLDASNGEPVIGAGVLISSGGGTVTDYDGKYVISAPMGAEIVFSSLGYNEVKETVDGRTVINVSLHPDTQLLDEVVVLGYTTQKRAELSSSVVSLSEEKLHDVTTPDVAPGAKEKMLFRLDTSALPKGECVIMVSLTTNSPLRPVVNLFVAGEVR